MIPVSPRFVRATAFLFAFSVFSAAGALPALAGQRAVLGELFSASG